MCIRDRQLRNNPECLLITRETQYRTTRKITHPLGRDFQGWFSRQRGEYERRATRTTMERSRWDISDVTILVVCTPDVLKKKSGSEIRPRGCVILSVTILYRNIMTVWNKYWCTNGHYIWGQSGIRYGWWYTWYGKLQRYIARTPRKHTNYSSCCCDHMNSWLQCSPCSQDRLQQLWSGRLPQEEKQIKTED